ncbi:radical SAM protein [Mariprofundus erugo]|uniref:radical SAM protein n=1 Tax=Mariprofundus erugo TaxID=2528639 RepID=UPI0010FF560D|nr:radical SAM protein [Mariprofundus erugo]TLS77642.1 radical SAM protein [Mariprofundus erugo]
MTLQLNTANHDRDVVGMTYVYPVVSRRAGGVSVGINLNPNHACDWHCAYCQVPGLVRGSAPAIDLQLLHEELQSMLERILHGDFMQQHVPESCRTLCDIAISGNGEPTGCRDFAAVVRTIVTVMRSFRLAIPLRLITNGSYADKQTVQQGLALMAACGGELWIKVDSATVDGIRRINGVSLSPERLFHQVKSMSEGCPAWIQTCMFAWDGLPPSTPEVDAYLALLTRLKADSVPLQGVLLYGLARPSMQPEAIHLAALEPLWMEQLAARIQAVGYPVRLSL